MKQKLLKLLLASAVVIWQYDDVQAQGTDPVNGGTYYLYNVDQGQFLKRGNDWGTQGSLLNTGESVTLTALPNGAYKLGTNNGSTFVFAENGSSVWMDGNGDPTGGSNKQRCYEWKIISQTDGTYLIQTEPTNDYVTNGLYLGGYTDEGLNNSRVHYLFSPTGHNAASVHWIFLTQEQYDEMQTNVEASAATRANLYKYIVSARAMGYTSEETDAYYNPQTDNETLVAALSALPGKLLAYAQENASEENPMDISFLIENSRCGVAFTSWTLNGTYSNNTTFYQNGDSYLSGRFFEIWKNNAALDNHQMSQFLTNLPVGKYTLGADVNAVWQSDPSVETTGVELFATAYEDGTVSCNTDGLPEYFTTSFGVMDGEATIGIRNTNTNANWLAFDNFKLYYKGYTADWLKKPLASTLEQAKGIDENPLNTYLKESLKNAIATAERAQESDDKTTVMNAIDDLKTVISNINTMVKPYADYIDMRDNFVKADILNVTGVYTDKDNAVATLNSAIEAANTAVEAATEISAITEQTAKLREAALDFIKTVTIEEGKYFDLTKLMANPGFDNNTTDGWNITHTGDLNTRVQCNEFYQATFDMYQTLTGLPNGSYTLSVKAFMRPGWADAVYNDFNNGINKVSAKLYVNNDESTIKNIMEHLQDTKLYNSENGGFADSEVDGKFIPNGMEGAQVYFAKGFYDTSVAALVNDGNLKLGFKNETSEGGYWTIFDDFRLYYYGTSEFIYKKQYFPQVQAEAQATLDNKLYENVAGAEKAGLTTAIATTPENTEEAYDAAITQIKEAQTAFIAAAPSYNRLVAAIATAKAQEVDCTDAESTLAAATTTAETAVSAANTLYTAVLNTFSMNELGFAAGECAPYNNVEAIQTFNKKAETIKDIASKSEADIDAMIQELKSVTWNVNDTEVNAVYDGNFALQEEQLPGTPNSAVLAGWNIKGGNMRYLIKNTEDYPGLNGASEKAAVFTYGGNYAYGETEGYTIPLKANTVYELSFKLAGWGGDGTGSVDKYNVSVLNENQEGLALTNVGGAPTGIKVENSLVNAKVRFRTGEAGNYVLTMNPGGNSVFTDVELLTAKAEDIAVKVSAEYGTMILPFDAEIPSNMEVYSVGSCSEQTEDYSVLNLEPVTDKIAANTPYIVKSDAIDFTFNGIALNNGNAYTDGLLTGVMTATPAPKGSYVLQKQEGKLGFYLVETDDIIVPANRAYLTIPETAAANVRAFVFDLGNVTGINHVEAADALVNVYSIDGVLVRKAVKASEALNGLQKGIYVVNGAKKAVK